MLFPRGAAKNLVGTITRLVSYPTVATQMVVVVEVPETSTGASGVGFAMTGSDSWILGTGSRDLGVGLQILSRFARGIYVSRWQGRGKRLSQRQGQEQRVSQGRGQGEGQGTAPVCEAALEREPDVELATPGAVVYNLCTR